MTLTSALYALLRSSRDVNAVNRAVSAGSAKPVALRVARRGVGKVVGRGMGRWLR